MSPIPDAELASLLSRLESPAVNPAPALALALAGLAPEAVCRVCMESLADRDTDLGTHPLCDPPARVEPQPPPTLDALSAALVAYDQGSARSQQVAVGPSEIGVGCDRRLAYALRNAPRQPNNTVPWAPILGTALHAHIAEALRAANDAAGRVRFLVEQRVWPAPDLSGSTDAYDIDTETVIDWKLVGKSTMEKARRPAGPSRQYVVQAHTYGRGWQRLGRDPKWVRIVFLPRWSHTITDAYEWTAPYSRLTAEQALQRVRELTAELHLADIDQHPENWARIAATPTSDACHWCPYHRPKVQAVNFEGCTGYTPKADRQVADYLDGLPANT